MHPIGEDLRNAREQAGLAVEDVAFATRIPRTVVLALEAADFTEFSSPLYAKSFLTQYSAFVHVDAQPWLDALEPSDFVGSGFVNPLWQAPPEPEKPVRSTVVQPAKGGWMAAVGLLVLTGGLIFAAIHGYAYFESRFGTDPQTAEVALTPEETVLSDRKKAVEPVRVVAEVKPPSPAAGAETVAAHRDDSMIELAPRAIPIPQ